MKILFATGKLNRGFSPTGKIIFQIARELAKKGHSCYMCGFSADTAETVAVEDGVNLLRWNSGLLTDKAQQAFDSYAATLGENARRSARKSFLFKNPLMFGVLGYRYSPLYNPSERAQRFGLRVKDFVLKENIDVVCAVYMPFGEAMQTVQQLDGIVPVYLYQTDPWGLHRLPEFAKDADIHIQQETELFAKAKHIVTTPALYRLYKEDSRYMPFVHKMTALNFPNIKPAATCKGESVFKFDDSCTNLLFCGLLEDEYRSPEIFLQTVCSLIDKGERIKVYFLGTSTSRALQGLCTEYPQNIFHHEAVSFDRAFATMKKADFLLNISNTLDNMVPSKIFDYFSLCKPVVNVQKIENCPSREYFDRYPLSFTFEDFAPDEKALAKFLTEAKGKTEKYQTVEKLFKDATIEYAAEKTEKILTDILNDK
ncbi:MAG: glycosyltransferase family 4 protein [Ruminococcaceae bacterium]|nr:glycosyltransferase family 4 protein [Oscillospiraceae bacterium]